MNINEKTRTLSFIILFLMVLFVPQVQAEELKKIVVMPFEIFSNQDKTALRESLYKNLSDELQKEKSIQVIPADEFLKSQEKIEENKAIDYGKSKGADFVITGTLTQFGKSMNIDAKITDVHKGSALSPVTAHGRGVANINSLTEQIKVEVLETKDHRYEL